ncbi:MAG: EamA family transporter [Acidimicrobiales bacterium]
MAPKPHLTVVGVAITWATIGLLVREVDLPAVAVAWGRVVIGAGGLGAWIVIRTRRRRGEAARVGWNLRYRPGLTLASGALLAVHWAAMFAAFQRAPIGSVLLIVYLAPVGVAAMAPRTLGERVGPTVVAALGLSVVGAACVVGPGTGGIGGSALGLAGLASVTYAAMVLVDKRLLADPTVDGLGLAWAKQATAAVVLAPFAVLARGGRLDGVVVAAGARPRPRRQG